MPPETFAWDEPAPSSAPAAAAPATFAWDEPAPGLNPSTAPHGSTDPGQLQLQEDRLRKMEAAPALPVNPMVQEIQQLAANPMLGDNELATTTMAKFAQAGVRSAAGALNTGQVDDARRVADAKYMQFMESSGLTNFIGGEESKKDKMQIRDGFFKAELLSRAPVDQNDGIPIAHGVMTKLIDERIKQIYDQVQGAGGKGIEEAQSLAAIAAELKALPEAMAWNLYRKATYEVQKRPANSWEAKVLQDEEPWYGVMPGSRTADAAIEQIRGTQGAYKTFREQFSIAGWQPIAVAPGESPTRKLLPEDMYGRWRQLFGAEGMRLMYDEVARSKVAYFYGKMGLVPGEAYQGLTPGFTVDGQNFTTFTPGGAIERLLIRGRGSLPDVKRSLTQIRNESGPEAEAAAAKIDAQDYLARIGSKLADVQGQPPELAQRTLNLTPVETEALQKNLLTAAISRIYDLGNLVGGEAKKATADVDETLSRMPFVQNTIIRGLAATGGMDPTASAKIHDLGEALTYFYRAGGPLRMALGDILIRTLPPPGATSEQRVRAEEFGFAPGSPIARDLVLARDENTLGKVEEAFNSQKTVIGPDGKEKITYGWNSHAQSDKNQAWLGQFYAGDIAWTPGNIVRAVGAAAQVTAHAATAGTAQMIASVIDDPHEVANIMVQGAMIGAVGKVISGGPVELARTSMGAWRLKNDLSGAIRQYPYELGRLLDTAKTMAQRAIDEGGLPSETLNNAISNLEAFTAKRSINGIQKDSGEAAAILTRAWPEIKNGLGDLGHQLGTKMIPRSWVAQVQKFFGAKRPLEPDLQALFGTEGAIDPAIRTLGEMTGATGDMRTFENSVTRFAFENSRAPTPDEMRPMWPKSFEDLHGAMAAAEKGTLKDPTFKRLYRFARRQNVADLQGVVDSADAMMNRYIKGALELADKTYSFGLPRDRSSMFLDVASRRLDNHIQVLEIEADLLRKQVLQGAKVTDQLRATEDEIFAHRREHGLLQKADQELWQHSPEKPWAFTPEIKDILFRSRPQQMFESGLLNPDTLGLMMDLNPVLFQGIRSEALWDSTRAPLPPSVHEELTRVGNNLADNITTARISAKAARKNRLAEDEQLKAFQRGLKSVQDAQARTAGTGVDFSKDIENYQNQIAQRTTLIKDETIDTPKVQAARAALEDAKRMHKEHQAMYARRRTEGIQVRRLDRSMFESVIRMGEHDGLGEVAKAHVLEMRSRLAGTLSRKEQRIVGNPFDTSFLPPHMRGQLVHDFIQHYGWRHQADLSQLQDLAEYQNGLSQVDKDALGKAQRTGGPYPAYLTQYAVHEGRNFLNLWGLMRLTRRTPEHVMKTLERFDLDPQISGLYRRPTLDRSLETKLAGHVEPRLSGQPELGVISGDWTEMMFKRDPDAIRVRVQEETQVLEKRFASETALNEWMDATYGKDAWRDIGKENEGLRKGRTLYGEPITIGNPMTPQEAEILDFAKGKTSEARLDVLSRGLRDVQTHLMVEGLNTFTGWVLDQKTYEAEISGHKGLDAQYVPIPDQPGTFGSLAGKWVHRNMIKELGKGSRFHSNLEAMLSGWRDVVESVNKASSFSEALGNLASDYKLVRGMRRINEFVKSNVILKSLKTWMINWTFNFFSDHAAGTHALSLSGLPRYFSEVVKGSPKAWEPYMREMEEHGIGGGFFGTSNEAMNNMELRLFQMDPKDRAAVEAKYAQRQNLRDRLISDDRLSAGAREAMNREIYALDTTLEMANQSWIKGLMGKIYGMFGGTKDALGRNLNETWGNFREAYNRVDSAFKRAQYAEMREKGMPATSAARVVRLFSQDYANIPGWVRNMHPILGSLVTSFPYEAGRILKNVMLYRPSRGLTMLATVPLMNLLSFSSAGISWDRAMAMLNARGKKGTIPAIQSLFTDLYLTDSSNGSITGSAGLGNMLPFAGLLQSRGAVAKVYDAIIPPEQRGINQQMIGAGIGYMSNFVGNNMLFNSGAYLLQGIDPMTGEKLMDNDTPWDQRLLTTMKLMAQDVLPPQLPLGRDWSAWEDGKESGISTKTGRPFKADEAVTAFVRGVTGLTFRGSTATFLANILNPFLGDKIAPKTRGTGALVDDNDLIMTLTHKMMVNMPGSKETDTSIAKYGEPNALRALIYRSLDNTLSPEQRKDAETRAAALYSSMKPVAGVPGVEVPSMTETQFRHLQARLSTGTATDVFALQPLNVQAATLTLLDAAGLPDVRQRELIHSMLYSEMGAVKLPTDPGIVASAMAFLAHRMQEPGHNPRLDALYKDLTGKAEVAKVKDTIDKLKAPALEKARRIISGAF